MSDLIRLQNRIANAFGSSPVSGEEPAKRVTVTPPPLSAEATFEPKTVKTVEARPRGLTFSPYLFGGAGLLASAAALAIGKEAGLYAVIGGLGSIGIGAVILHFLTRSSTVVASAPPPQPVLKVPQRAPVSALALAERQQDARWGYDESAAIHDSIHNALGDIVLTRDLEGRILSANAVFRRLVADVNPQGRTCQDLGLLFEPASQPGRFEVEMLTERGPRTFLWHDVTTRDARSGDLVVQSLARDVTDERQLARAREDARLRAEEASDAKSRLLATVSHEIRTPLGGILGMASLISRTRLSPEQASYIEGVRQSGEALGQLVDELLDCASIEAGRFTVNPVIADTRPFIEGVCEMLAHRAHAKGLEIAVTVDASVPGRLEFDSARVRQVLFNLIGNAVKFTRTGGVLIAAMLEGQDLVITVTDTGPGMNEAELAKIFREFEQVGAAGERSGGTGLGLTISTRIMAALGGTLSAASRKGAGSTFTLRLPVRAVQGEVNREERGLRLAASHVLLVAPAGPAARATVSTLLTLGARCRHVTTATEAAQALEGTAKSGPFTDIIVDHRLSQAFARAVPARAADDISGPRRIFLVNPEERTARRRGDYDAWLIRPLREKSLADVLTGRMHGVEQRDALNDNRPLPGFANTEPVVANANGLRILLAEDDPVNAMLARSTLEKEGHRVTHVMDFSDVLDVMLAPDGNRPDLLITDLNMPGGDGIDVIARIRAAERERGFVRTPVLVLSADKRRQAAQRALLNGADVVMEKPAGPERLLEEIKAIRRAQVDEKSGV
ncbi:MAG: hybrid sensor histidine kinase/response regulator [Shinella sp.]|nr:MAG: hybrid sensor histidine kinase/response regulator [Shinella sp.]